MVENWNRPFSAESNANDMVSSLRCVLMCLELDEYDAADVYAADSYWAECRIQHGTEMHLLMAIIEISALAQSSRHRREA